MSRIYLGPLTDPVKRAKIGQKRRVDSIETSKFTSFYSDINIANTGTGGTQVSNTGVCQINSSSPALGICLPGFSVTGSYGFEGMPLDMAIKLYKNGQQNKSPNIPGNATAFAGPSISGSNPRNGTEINAFVSGDGSIYNESLYSEIVAGGYKFRNTDIESELSFITCEAYDNYTSNKIADFQGYGVVGDKTIDSGDGTELDDSHCGSLSSFIGTYKSEASCLAGSYTLGGVAYSGSNLTWSTYS